MVLFGFLSILASLRVCGASPPVPLVTNLTAVFGDTVVLPCDGAYYVDQLSEQELEAALEWSTMGEDVLSNQGEGLTAGKGYEGRVFLPPEGLVKGNFSLELRKVVLRDANIYECIWQGRKTISTVWLHVDEDNWKSTPTVRMLSDDLQEGSTVCISAPPVPTAMATVTSSHLARGQDEAMTLAAEPDIVWLETLPWVRIGIIAGVLSLTALVLGILLATHKI
ncbi:uncharacterized protein [Osmerus mordax]|uniref:uncharacterized protein isoform X2 n=1 Tax=Osmerus mordax TaxID=8014 RepID=UPI00351051FC